MIGIFTLKTHKKNNEWQQIVIHYLRYRSCIIIPPSTQMSSSLEFALGYPECIQQ